MTSSPNVRQRGPHDYDAWTTIDPQYLGSAPRSTDAQARADRVRYDQLRHGIDLVGAWDTLYSGAPAPTTHLASDVIDRAAALFVRLHERRATGYVMTNEVARAVAALRTQSWAVRADGTLEMTGDLGLHVVNDRACRIDDNDRHPFCPSHLFHVARHAGECKHIVARELIRLGQLLAEQHASCATIATQLLVPLLDILRQAGSTIPLIVDIQPQRVRLVAFGAPIVYGGVVPATTTGRPTRVELPGSAAPLVYDAVTSLCGADTAQITIAVEPDAVIFRDPTGICHVEFPATVTS